MLSWVVVAVMASDVVISMSVVLIARCGEELVVDVSVIDGLDLSGLVDLWLIAMWFIMVSIELNLLNWSV